MKISQNVNINNKKYTINDFSEEKIEIISELKGALKENSNHELSDEEVKKLHKERITKKNEDIS